MSKGPMDKLQSAFSKWEKNLDDSSWESAFAYELEHKYTNSNLRFENLKGNDMAKCSFIKQVCTDHRFSMYLPILRRPLRGTVMMMACMVDFIP
jgi:hypothetical protein